MGEHKRLLRLRPSQVAEMRAKEIALEVLFGADNTHTVKSVQDAGDVVFSVSFEQVWRPIKTALLGVRGNPSLLDIEIVGESMPISDRPS